MSIHIVQLTDLHLFEDPDGLLAGVRTWSTFRAVLDEVKKLHGDLDYLILTGDLAQDEALPTYLMLREALGDWVPCCRIIPGNHDNRAHLRDAFPELFEESQDKLTFALSTGGWRILGLDTHVPGQVRGRVDDAQLEWLRAQLASAPATPTLLFLHHPPVPINVGWLDELGLDDAGEYHRRFTRDKNRLRRSCAPGVRRSYRHRRDVYDALDLRAIRRARPRDIRYWYPCVPHVHAGATSPPHHGAPSGTQRGSPAGALIPLSHNQPSGETSVNLKDPSLFRQQCYIDGEWVDAGAGGTSEVTNPADGSVLGQVPALGADETRRAIEAADKAWPAWRAKTGKERCNILRKWFNLMMENQSDLAVLMTSEQGKPLAESMGEIAYAASFIEWFAEEAKRVYGDTINHPLPGKRIVVLKQPHRSGGVDHPMEFSCSDDHP